MQIKILEDKNFCVFCKRQLSKGYDRPIKKQICPECLKIINVTAKNDFSQYLSVFAHDLKKFITKIIHVMKTFNYFTIILYGDRDNVFASILVHYLKINNIHSYTLLDYTEGLSRLKIGSKNIVQVGISFSEYTSIIESKTLLKKLHFNVLSLLFYQYDCDTILERFNLLKHGIQCITIRFFDIWYLPIEIVLELRSSIIESMDSIKNDYELYLGKVPDPKKISNE